MGKRLPCPTERQEQDALIRWCRMMVETNQEPRLRLLRCGFEGLRLSMGVRMQMKRQSVSKSWPDIFLSIPFEVEPFGYPIALYEYCGLYIEMKRLKGGIVSDDQKKMHKLLRAQGYKVVVCKGADAAIAEIKAYLGIK
jgi:hypothetical protein